MCSYFLLTPPCPFEWRGSGCEFLSSTEDDEEEGGEEDAAPAAGAGGAPGGAGGGGRPYDGVGAGRDVRRRLGQQSGSE